MEPKAPVDPHAHAHARDRDQVQRNETPKPPEVIVFFDGVCGLCNGFVDFLLQVDSRRRLRFAPLQGTTASHLLSGVVSPEVLTGLQSIVVYAQGRVHLRSAAIIYIFIVLGWPWSLLSVARLIPATSRDWLYEKVASNRYSWFGKRESCRLPKGDERTRFLD